MQLSWHIWKDSKAWQQDPASQPGAGDQSPKPLFPDQQLAEWM